MAGVGSRRHCDRLIAEGRVQVNGENPEHAGTRIDPASDTVHLDGRPVRLPRRQISLILNKPRGILVTLKDQRGRPTITALLEDIPERVFPVGRLDKESEGLLLLTNDGDLAFRVAHPRFGLPKTYHVTVGEDFDRADLERLRKGVQLTEGLARPISASILRRGPDESEIEIILGQGRKREIRRMLSRLGFEVTTLRRVALGNLKLGKLRPGQWRLLDSAELSGLRRTLGLEEEDSGRDG
jgi:pseudouridine synthase